jgi:hypothetical protein
LTFAEKDAFFAPGGFMRKATKSGLVVLLCFSQLVMSVAAEKSSANEKVIKVGNAAPAGAPVKEIQLSAKKYQYDPASVEVPVSIPWSRFTSKRWIGNTVSNSNPSKIAV